LFNNYNFLKVLKTKIIKISFHSCAFLSLLRFAMLHFAMKESINLPACAMHADRQQRGETLHLNTYKQIASYH